MHHYQTEVIKVNAQHPDAPQIEQAAELIRRGELVVFPTETVYGLGADALQPQAVERIFAAKGRPFSDPLIVHIADEETLATLVEEIPPAAHQLARVFWPGPLTIILRASKRVPRLITAGQPTVAIRMPRHTVAQALIRAAGTPIAAPSANRFMHVSPTTAQHALADLQDRIPLILDGGPCEVGVESTVLDLCTTPPIVLRPGGVSLEALRTILPEVQPPRQVQARSTKGEEDVALTSPGQMLIHYSPTVPTYLYEGQVSAIHTAILDELQRRQERGEQVGVLTTGENVVAFRESGARIYTLGSTSEQVARNLFAGLRALEETGVDVILCQSFDEKGLGLAVRDRLRKAAGGKIIQCK